MQHTQPSICMGVLVGEDLRVRGIVPSAGVFGAVGSRLFGFELEGEGTRLGQIVEWFEARLGGWEVEEPGCGWSVAGSEEG